MVRIVLLTVGLIKISLYKMSYYPEARSHGRSKVKVEFNLSYYATKADLKGATGVDTSNLAAKSDLASLKAEVDIDKINFSN